MRYAPCLALLFKPVTIVARHGKRVGDPDRPFLNDNILFWLLRDSGLLVAGLNARQIEEHLVAVEGREGKRRREGQRTMVAIITGAH